MITAATNSTRNLSFAELSAELVRAAILAPSPDNNQPWLFAIQSDRLLICPDNRHALPSDADDMFMYMAIGAAAENACLAARQRGFLPQVCLRPMSECGVDLPGDGQAAELTLRPGAEPDPLVEQLSARCTSRKPYSTRPLELSTLQALSQSVDCFPGMQVDWVSRRSDIGKLAGVVAQGDLIRLQHRPFHEELYKQLRFTAAAAEQTRDGLDLRTLELPPGTGAVLHWLRHWSRMKLLHATGVGKLFALPTLMTVRSSGALGILSVPERSSNWFFTSGRALERLWLGAAQQGLSLQPLGSLPIFFAHLHRSEKSGLSIQHLNRISRLQERFAGLYPHLANRSLVMLVRIGHASPPQVRSLRRGEDKVMAKKILPEGSPANGH